MDFCPVCRLTGEPRSGEAVSLQPVQCHLLVPPKATDRWAVPTLGNTRLWELQRHENPRCLARVYLSGCKAPGERDSENLGTQGDRYLAVASESVLGKWSTQGPELWWHPRVRAIGDVTPKLLQRRKRFQHRPAGCIFPAPSSLPQKDVTTTASRRTGTGQKNKT
jgi:hypothetical protein